MQPLTDHELKIYIESLAHVEKDFVLDKHLKIIKTSEKLIKYYKNHLLSLRKVDFFSHNYPEFSYFNTLKVSKVVVFTCFALKY